MQRFNSTISLLPHHPATLIPHHGRSNPGARRSAQPVCQGRRPIHEQVPEARPKGIRQDLPGRRYRIRHHGSRRIRRQADSHSHQPDSRRGRISQYLSCE